MPINFNKPAIADNYSTGYTQDLVDSVRALGRQMDGETIANPIVGLIRFNSTTSTWERYNGTSWLELATVYLKTASYTPADVLAKLLTVDGAGSLLDADFLDGQSGAYYADIVARLGYTPLNAASYSAADVLAKLLTVDGAGSLLDADLLDGQSGAFYQNAGNLNAGVIPAARVPSVDAAATIDGALIGWRDVPANAQSSGYTLALTDRGRSVDTSAGVTVPPNSTVPFPVGSTVTITNVSGAAITITQGGGVTMYLAGTATTGNGSLAQRGVATVRKVSTDTWHISGAGLS